MEKKLLKLWAEYETQLRKNDCPSFNDFMVWLKSRQKPERWQPGEREQYFYIDSECTVANTSWYSSNKYDQASRDVGNCFPTRKAAEIAAEVVKKTLLDLSN